MRTVRRRSSREDQHDSSRNRIRIMLQFHDMISMSIITNRRTQQERYLPMLVEIEDHEDCVRVKQDDRANHLVDF